MSDPDLDAVLNDEQEAEEPEKAAVEDAKSAEAEAEDGEVSKEDKPEPMMPVAAHVAERKELQKRAEFAEDVARAATKVEPVKPADPVDFLAEPEKIAGFIDQKIKQATEGLSKSYAVRQHGRDAVEKAYADLRDHGTPVEQRAISASDDPWGETVDRHKRREALAEIGDDPAAYRKSVHESVKKELLAEATVKQVKGLDPAPSLADSPNLGSRADTSGEPEDKDSLKSLIGE